MTREQVVENHLRLLKELHDENSWIPGSPIFYKLWAFLAVWSVAAICNALLEVAAAVREKSR